MPCICARAVSAISSRHPKARAAVAILSMTCSRFFSLFLTVSVRQVDIASNAAFTALRASSERPGANVGLKLREVTCAILLGMTLLPLTDARIASLFAVYVQPIVTAPSRTPQQLGRLEPEQEPAPRRHPRLQETT